MSLLAKWLSGALQDIIFSISKASWPSGSQDLEAQWDDLLDESASTVSLEMAFFHYVKFGNCVEVLLEQLLDESNSTVFLEMVFSHDVQFGIRCF